MLSRKKELIALLKKHRLGKTSPAEQAFLEQYYLYFDREPKASSTMGEEDKIQLGAALFTGIQNKIAAVRVVSFYKRTWFRIAAAAILILTTGTIYFISGDKKQLAENTVSHDIAAPAITKATITLTDGRTIALDSVNNGTFATQGNMKLMKNANGEISYQPTATGQPANLAFNILSNPRGSRPVSLTLADGSRVWLNAESSLRYPVAFTGNERKVEITGEAYFEVKHNEKMPFTVSANGVDVHDLGTSFNINAYGDEDAVKVTLLEGSVKVGQTGNSKQQTVLKPGQQATLTATNHELQTINGVDLSEVTAWRDNRFYFMSTNINSIAGQLSRWYDVDITVQPGFTNHFTGIISRSVNAGEVFRMLQQTGAMKLKIDGRKIEITK
jgi:hypothetical protein